MIVFNDKNQSKLKILAFSDQLIGGLVRYTVIIT